MKQLTIALFLLLPGLTMADNFEMPKDTIIYHNNKKIVINDSINNITVDIYSVNAKGDTICNEKIYEGVFIGDKSVEKEYNSSFTISVPDIFKPKSKRRITRSHWAGFGVGFSNLPEGFDFDGEMASIVNVSRALQYNLNFTDGYFNIGNGNLKLVTGLGIQFNSLHFQNNKAIEVVDYKSMITTTDVGSEYNNTRLHVTYMTVPLLLETCFPVGKYFSHIFLNGGIVLKAKTASSSKVWKNVDGRERKTKMPGDLNLRPFTFDILVQAGFDDYGFFASYSPLNLFLDNKGPKGNQATVGFHLYF
jgi:hypothetical protein